MLQEPAFPLRRLNSRVETPEGVWVLWSYDGRNEISQARDLSLGVCLSRRQVRGPWVRSPRLISLSKRDASAPDAVVRHLNPGHGVGLQFMAMRHGDRSHLAALLNRLSRSSSPETPAF